MGAIRFAGQSVILHYRLKLTLASYRNQDIGQVAICSKTLFRSVWTVWQNCVAEQCKCNRTVWRILLSESVWCPWQPASQQPPPQQDAIFIFPMFSFPILPLFFYTKFSQESSSSPPCLIQSFLVDIRLCVCLCIDILFVFALSFCLPVSQHCICHCHCHCHCPAQGNLCSSSTSVR